MGTFILNRQGRPKTKNTMHQSVTKRIWEKKKKKKANVR